jgi:hypothetical protein
MQLARSFDDVAQLRLDGLRSGQHQHSPESLRAIIELLEQALAILGMRSNCTGSAFWGQALG